MSTKIAGLQNTLQSLGFTKYEIAIMLKLYKTGPSNAEQLKDTNLPLSRAYDALEILRRKRFVTVSQGRPRVYTAVEPELAMTQFLEDQKQKQQELMQKHSQLASKFLNQINEYYQPQTEVSHDELMFQFSTLKEAEDKTIQMINKARKSIRIFTHLFKWFDRVKLPLSDAIKRGCEVMILLQGNVKKELVAELKSLGMKVKVLNKTVLLTRGTIVDHSSVLFVIWAERNLDEGNKIYRPQFSTNLGIVEIFNLSFNYLWG